MRPWVPIAWLAFCAGRITYLVLVARRDPRMVLDLFVGIVCWLFIGLFLWAGGFFYPLGLQGFQ